MRETNERREWEAPAIIELSLPFRQAGYEVSKTLIDPASGLVDPGHIITHQVDFRDVSGAFDITERNPRYSCKVLLDFGA